MSEPVIDYYTMHFDETLRHRSDAFGIIQEIRTKELISRFIGSGKKNILDIGGATGVYSFHLAGCGHDVSLLDIVPQHIQKAKELNEKSDFKLKDIILHDARIYKSDNEYDMIILHGPLYHIIDRDQRVILLRNMKRLLSNDGVILGFGISRYAGYFYGVRSGRILQSDYGDIVSDEVESGIRDSGPSWYFHKPEELESEFIDAGMKVIDMKSVVTQIWMLPDIDNMIMDTKRLKGIIEIAQRYEDEIDIAQDIMCVGC